MAFLDDLVFPWEIGKPATGGPRWAVDVVVNDAGYEQRNCPWQYPLSSYEARWGIKSVADLETLVAIFHAARGMLHGFRYRDPLDWKSCPRNNDIAYDDQLLLENAAGGETEIQLIKNYSYAGYTVARKITRPFGAVPLGLNGSSLTEGVDYTVDLGTGKVTLVTPLVYGDDVTGGFSYHVPVRFDTNTLPVQLQEYEYGSASVPLVEIRE